MYDYPPDYFSFLLIVLAALIAYLYASVARRQRAKDARFEEERLRIREKYLPRTSDFLSTVATQIQRLRKDHIAGVHTHPHQAYYQRSLIAAFLQAVTSRSYFHRVRFVREIEKHDAQI
jgi:hypothetical protein